MINHNQVMDFVWLLNAADNSSLEVKDLYSRFLSNRDMFHKLKEETDNNPDCREYLGKEIRRSLKSINELKELLDEAFEVLQNYNPEDSIK